MSSNFTGILDCALPGRKQGKDAQLEKSRFKNQCMVAHVTLLSIKLHRASIPQDWICDYTYARVDT